MINSEKDIKWVKKASSGHSAKSYDVHLGIASVSRKHGPCKMLNFRFSERGKNEVGGDYILYAYDGESKRVFFKRGTEENGYSLGKKAPWAFICSAGEEVTDALNPYQGRYEFRKMDDGTLFIQLGEMK